METRITRSPRVAAAILRAGGLVAFPTETVYGLGADARDARAVAAIFSAKGRPPDNPLIVHVANPAQMAQVADRVPAAAYALLTQFAPGPLTVIVPRHPAIPLAVTAGLDTVGVRVPSHPVARALLMAFDGPVAAPSANRSGRPSPTTWPAVVEELDGRVDAILQGRASSIGLESTVIDCTCEPPLILREGAITREAILEVCPELADPVPLSSTEPVRSPGQKYRHYAPTAKVVVVNQPRDIPPRHAPQAAYIGLSHDGFVVKPQRIRRCSDITEYARTLFRFFRACEKQGIQYIYCQRVPETGLGRALMDRLKRAAHAGT